MAFTEVLLAARWPKYDFDPGMPACANCVAVNALGASGFLPTSSSLARDRSASIMASSQSWPVAFFSHVFREFLYLMGSSPLRMNHHFGLGAWASTKSCTDAALVPKIS